MAEFAIRNNLNIRGMMTMSSSASETLKSPRYIPPPGSEDFIGIPSIEELEEQIFDLDVEYAEIMMRIKCMISQDESPSSSLR